MGVSVGVSSIKCLGGVGPGSLRARVELTPTRVIRLFSAAITPTSQCNGAIGRERTPYKRAGRDDPFNDQDPLLTVVMEMKPILVNEREATDWF